MRSKISMKKMEKVLKTEGYVVINYDYPSRNKTILEHGEDLVLILQAHASEHPSESFHFVTHSMGGLVLRAALNHPNCPAQAKLGRSVLLGPPNQGSAFGRFVGQFDPIRKALGNEAGKELTTREEFDDIGEFPSLMEVLVISGTAGWNPAIEGENDMVVGVHESCLNSFHRHMCIPTLHTFMMLNDSVIFNVVRFISNNSGE